MSPNVWRTSTNRVKHLFSHETRCETFHYYHSTFYQGESSSSAMASDTPGRLFLFFFIVRRRGDNRAVVILSERFNHTLHICMPTFSVNCKHICSCNHRFRIRNFNVILILLRTDSFELAFLITSPANAAVWWLIAGYLHYQNSSLSSKRKYHYD
jgi:hypothetical protein